MKIITIIEVFVCLTIIFVSGAFLYLYPQDMKESEQISLEVAALPAIGIGITIFYAVYRKNLKAP